MKLLLMLGYFLIFAFAAGFFAWLHVRFWGAFYHIEPRCDELHYVTCDDGWRVALRRYRGALELAEHPIVLCHGLGGTHGTMDFEPDRSLAAYLNGLGFEVWNMELRGVGVSSRPTLFSRRRWSILFEDYVDLDVPAVLRHILQETGAGRVHWVGHGLGGLIGYAFAQGPGAPLLASVTGIGAPCRLRPPAGVRALVPFASVLALAPFVPTRLLARALAPFYFHGPLGDLAFRADNLDPVTARRMWANAFDDVPSTLLRQLARWVVVGDCVADEDDRNFTRAMGAITTPLLAISGDRDLVAPPSTARYVVEHASSAKKAWLNLGGEGAGAELPACGHLDLVFGRHAVAHVFPRVAGWIAEVAGVQLDALEPEGAAVARAPAPAPAPTPIPGPTPVRTPRAPATSVVSPPPVFDRAAPEPDAFVLDLDAPPLAGYGDADDGPDPAPRPVHAAPTAVEVAATPEAATPVEPAEPAGNAVEPDAEPPGPPAMAQDPEPDVPVATPELLPAFEVADAPHHARPLRRSVLDEPEDGEIEDAEWEEDAPRPGHLVPAPRRQPEDDREPPARRRASTSMPVVRRSTTGERRRIRRPDESPVRRAAPPGWGEVVEEVARGASRPQRLHRSPVSGDAMFEALRLASSRAGAMEGTLATSLLEPVKPPVARRGPNPPAAGWEELPLKRSPKTTARIGEPEAEPMGVEPVPARLSPKLRRRLGDALDDEEGEGT